MNKKFTSLNEAATVRARARAAARALRDLLKEKVLPAELRKQVENLSMAMGKTWADLEADAKLDPERESTSPLEGGGNLREAANMGEWFEAMLHLRFTEMADYAFADGRLSRDERIAMSHAIGQGLDAFHLTLMGDAVQLYVRNPWAQVEAPESPVMAAAAEGEAVVAMVAAEGGAAGYGNGDVLDGAAAPLRSEYVALVERAVRQDGTIPLKIIAPGWGSSGYYAADMLENSAAKFPKGTKMYWDHPTPTEERERPERSLRDLAAETVTDAVWQAQGAAGPGLYAEAKVFDAFRPALDELGPHIGVSIRALGKAVAGQADGRTGKLISEISKVGSVDFVTQPGAGGQVLQIFEAARSAPTLPFMESENSQAAGRGEAEKLSVSKEVEMPEDLKALQEANATLSTELGNQKMAMARLSEALVLREAGDFVRDELAKVQLPEVTKSRLQMQLVKVAPIKEGRVDVVAYAALIAEAVKAEQTYLAEAAGYGSGRITGFGGGQQPEPKPEEFEASMAESFRRMGLDENIAKQAAKGR